VSFVHSPFSNAKRQPGKFRAADEEKYYHVGIVLVNVVRRFDTFGGGWGVVIVAAGATPAIKVREMRKVLGQRVCSECGAPLPADARPSALTCSRRCRVIRFRRLKSEAAKLEIDAINRDRANMGCPR